MKQCRLLQRAQELLPRGYRLDLKKDEELNLLSYLQHLRRWRFTQIQKSYFPSLSPSALLGAYWRLSTEDRVRRASAVAAPISTPHYTTRDSCSARSTQSTRPDLEQGPSYLHHPTSCPLSQAESSTETSILPSPISATGDEPVAQSINTNRYNLRPNRPTPFPQGKPRYLVDRRRFPHFSKSYKYHLNLHGRSDRDYVTLSHTPTPNSSDRSLSIVSSPPSVASSLEFFGLEARSLNSSDRDSSVTSSLSDDISSAEFLSSEERPPTP
ncbi:hypothetical protein PENPOL_c016G07254 [Penicillium polonicum]|uniref:Uncharacterized protein n=1 Tax=Penicillium polonicum TaxID=60169 RepID=A0A1V6N9Y0_PENPO|nr:hypothetical protein PENPOL_c016G07254 [Penicillium polonicum]